MIYRLRTEGEQRSSSRANNKSDIQGQNPAAVRKPPPREIYGPQDSLGPIGLVERESLIEPSRRSRRETIPDKEIYRTSFRIEKCQ